MSAISCRHCAGAVDYLGALGRLVYGRCRDCGLTQATRWCPDCSGMGEILVEEPWTLGDGAQVLHELCGTCDGSGLQPTPEP